MSTTAGTLVAVAGMARNAGSSPPHRTVLVAMSDTRSEHDAGIAQILIAIDQVDLPHLDFPVVCRAHEAMAAPAGEIPSPVHAELADQEIRADHVGGAHIGFEHFDVRAHAYRARFRRLRPSVAGAQAVDPVFHAAAVVEADGDLLAGIARLRCPRYPVDAFGRIHRQPFVEAELV